MPVFIGFEGEQVVLKGSKGEYRLSKDDILHLVDRHSKIAEAIGEEPKELWRALVRFLDLSFLDHFRVAIDVVSDVTLKPHEKMDFLSTLKPLFKSWLVAKLMDLPTLSRRLKLDEVPRESIAEVVIDKAKPEEVVSVIVECLDRLGFRFAKTLSGRTLFIINSSHLVTYDAFPYDVIKLFDLRKKGLADHLEEVLLSKARTIILREDCNPSMLLPFQNAVLDISTWRWWPLSDNPPFFTFWVECALETGVVEHIHELDLNYWRSQCPKFLSLIERLFSGENFDRCLEMLGSILIPSVLRRIFLVVGPPGVGKSTFAEVLVRSLKGLCTTVNLEAIAESRFNWDLMGKLVNISAEGSYVFVDRRGIARLNRLSGDATLVFERKYHDRVEGPNYLKLIFLLNDLPLFSSVDEALLDRLYIIETVEERVGEPKPVEEVVKEVLKEREQIIHFLLWCSYQLTKDGYVRFQHDIPLDQKKELLLQSMNPVAQWVEERCATSPEAVESRKRLYSDYESWAKERGKLVLSKAMFYSTLRGLGYKEVRRHGEYYFKGLRLREEREGEGLEAFT